jgi:hypothetical protein
MGLAAVGVLAGLASPALAQGDRVSGTEKGSLFIISKIDVVYDTGNNLVQDTFVQLTNDFPADVRVQMYFIQGDTWTSLDNAITLTANQPTWWRASDGTGGTNVSPWTTLGEGIVDPDTGYTSYRGYIIGWAVDAGSNLEIKHNHLAANATIVNYYDNWAWGYNGWGFARNSDAAGDAVLEVGTEYAPAYAQLLMNFQAVGSSAYSSDSYMVTTDTDVTLHPVSADLRQETNGAIVTKAHYDVWNENEVKFSGAYHCVICWDQTLLSDYGVPNHFRLPNLQTDAGKARIDGLASFLCDFEPEFNASTDEAILGLSATFMDISGDYAAAGSNLFGMGTESAVIEYDPSGPPDEAPVSIPAFDFSSFLKSLSSK